jgi:hypothetical protein
MLKQFSTTALAIAITTIPVFIQPTQAKEANPKAVVATGAIKNVVTPDTGIKAEVAKMAIAVKEYYRDTNLRFEPKPESWSGACSFWEITNLKVTSLKENRAEVQASYIDRSYSLIGDKSIPNPPEKWGFRYQAMRDHFANPDGSPRIKIHNLQIEKQNGRWQVTGR